MKILIADSMSDKAVDILKENGLDVDVRTGLTREQLADVVGVYDGVVVRSATKVTREIIARGDRLKVIGRAGIGVDNVDVEAATEKGIVVMNTPQGNALEAIESGQVAAAGLDVFEQEPPPGQHPLILSERVVCTPHLGASTKEAQSKVAIDIANQIVDFALHGVIKNGVNAPSRTSEVLARISPYLALSDRLGRFVSMITEFPIQEVNIDYLGQIADAETPILTQGILKNILAPHLEGINYVNAPSVARSRGIRIKESKEREHDEFTSLLKVQLKGDGKEQVVFGTLLGKKQPWLVRVNNIDVDAELSGNILFVYNQDRPGFIAGLSTELAGHGINIGSMHVGREAVGALAMSVLGLDQKVDDEVMEEIRRLPNMVWARQIDLS